METDLLEDLKGYKPSIIACGGGVAMRTENVESMKRQGKILLLTASPETIYAHVKDSTNRPLLKGRMSVEGIAELMAKREPKYMALQACNRLCQSYFSLLLNGNAHQIRDMTFCHIG